MLVNNKIIKSGGIILAGVINSIYQKKLKLFIFIVLFFIFSHFTIVQAQVGEISQEKQLRIFQLSHILEEEKKFDLQQSYFNNAKVYYYNEHYSMAVSELEKIEYSNLYIPLYLRSQLLKGQCYEKLQRWESAVYVYQNINENIPLMKDYSSYFLAKAYLKIYDINRAIGLFQEIIEEYPDSALVPHVRYQIALAYLGEGNLDYFLEESRLAIDAAVEETFKAGVLNRLSNVLWEDKQFLNSLVYLKNLIENRYNPERMASYENLFVQRYQIARKSENIEMTPDLLLFCAGLYFNYRQYEVSEKIYDEVITLYPDQVQLADVYYDRARAVHYQGDYERGIDQCIYILENFGDNEDIIIRTTYLYAGALLSSENRVMAVEKYKEIIEKYPESYFAQLSYLQLSEIKFLQNQEEDGIKILDQLISKYPASSQAREASWKLARYYTNYDEKHNALKYYKTIYDNFPDSSRADDALYWFGKLQDSLDRENSRQVYKMLLDNYPDSYYTIHIPEETKQENTDIGQIIKNSKSITFSDIKSIYIPVENDSQLAIYKAELLNSIGIYTESASEIIKTLSYEPGNIYLLYLLTEIYYQNQEYYRSIGYAQALLDYFFNNDRIKEIPFQFWQYAFPDNYISIISEQANEYDLDPLLVLATIREESHFNSYSESRAGARGLMQIILSTGEWIAQKLDIQPFNYDLLFNPAININFGCWYYRYLQEKYDKNFYLMISAYNAGPGVTDRWVQQFNINDIDSFVENIPYDETTEHIKKVMRSYQIYKFIYR
ncbi:MAG: transglycosylase SLT domain-containing protein [Atribacterota bacterium]|nr:transglycosylase SLT domain-containing protein [Atribacterota bacterium]